MNARQSTARTFMIGPVLDADGVAVTTAVVGDFKVSKNGGIPAALDAGSTLVHRHTGHYSLAAAAGDYDTVGTAQFSLDKTTDACQPVGFDVIEEAVYDALFAASAVGPLLANSNGSGLTEAGGTGDHLTALATAAAVSTIDGIVDSILDDTDLIDDATSGLAKIATDVAAILVDTAVIGAAGAGLTEAGGTGDHLTAVPWNAAWDAEVQSEVDDAIAARFTFTVEGFCDANVKYVHDIEVDGAGTSGDPWGPV